VPVFLHTVISTYLLVLYKVSSKWDEVIFIGGLVCISLMISDVEHVFTYLVFFFFFFLMVVVLGFDLRVSCLLDRSSTACANSASPFLCWVFSRWGLLNYLSRAGFEL
jgi:hypothetical protein